MIGAVLVASGAFGLSRIRMGLELTDVIPKETAPYEFLAARERVHPGTSFPE